MLRAVDKHGITPDFIVGTSAGALNGALIASRPQTVATTDAFGGIWRELRRAQVLPLNPVTGLLGFLRARNPPRPECGLRRLISKTHRPRTGRRVRSKARAAADAKRYDLPPHLSRPSHAVRRRPRVASRPPPRRGVCPGSGRSARRGLRDRAARRTRVDRPSLPARACGTHPGAARRRLPAVLGAGSTAARELRPIGVSVDGRPCRSGDRPELRLSSLSMHCAGRRFSRYGWALSGAVAEGSAPSPSPRAAAARRALGGAQASSTVSRCRRRMTR